MGYLAMPLFASSGTTPSEQYLARLCQSTFLTLWSYPNVFRDQHHPGATGDGKEVCDLLVVYGNDIIIFSDKSCGFPNTGNLAVDWCRWFRRSVSNSAKQVFGAERWIRAHPDRLFLDRHCTRPFPLPLGNIAASHFHRVVVALGARDRCRREHGGTGSLIVAPHLVGQSHLDARDPHFQPFAVGVVEPEHGFVHIFDDRTLDIVLRELDTVSDFLRYLKKKEAVVLDRRIQPAEEPDLLAHYLTNMDQSRQHGFDLPATGPLTLRQGGWQSLQHNPRYVAKKLQDKISYLWDMIIETFSEHVVSGTLVMDSPATVRENELALRAMASESRFARRNLSMSLKYILNSTPTERIGIRTVLPEDPQDTIYVLIAMSNPDMTEERFRLHRRGYLSDYCKVVAWKHRHCQRIIGLATEVGIGDRRSYDLVHLETREWTDEMEAEARQIQATRAMFTRTSARPFHNEEYPETTNLLPVPNLAAPARPGPNDPCPCGSGRKYKRCCLGTQL